jgi:hypothetical protein
MFSICCAAVLVTAGAAPAKAQAPARTAPADMAPAAMAPATMATEKAMAPAAKTAPAKAQAPAESAQAAKPTEAQGAAVAKKRKKPFWEEEEEKERRHYDKGAVAIVVPIAFFLFIFLIIGAIAFFSWRKDQQRHQTLRLMVEKGAQIPADLITRPERKKSDLRRGLVLIATGLGIAIFLAVADRSHSGGWALGIIPALIGCGYLLAWRLEGQKNGNGSQNGTTWPVDRTAAITPDLGRTDPDA